MDSRRHDDFPLLARNSPLRHRSETCSKSNPSRTTAQSDGEERLQKPRASNSEKLQIQSTAEKQKDTLAFYLILICELWSECPFGAFRSHSSPEILHVVKGSRSHRSKEADVSSWYQRMLVPFSTLMDEPRRRAVHLRPSFGLGQSGAFAADSGTERHWCFCERHRGRLSEPPIHGRHENSLAHVLPYRVFTRQHAVGLTVHAATGSKEDVIRITQTCPFPTKRILPRCWKGGVRKRAVPDGWMDACAPRSFMGNRPTAHLQRVSSISLNTRLCLSPPPL